MVTTGEISKTYTETEMRKESKWFATKKKNQLNTTGGSNEGNE